MVVIRVTYCNFLVSFSVELHRNGQLNNCSRTTAGREEVLSPGKRPVEEFHRSTNDNLKDCYEVKKSKHMLN